MQLVTEIKHWDWTTGQLTSVAYCTTHKNKCWEGCLPSMRRKCRLYNCSVTPIHPPSTTLLSLWPAAPAQPSASPSALHCHRPRLKTAPCARPLQESSPSSWWPRAAEERRVQRTVDRLRCQTARPTTKKKGETFFFLFGGIRGKKKKKTNKLQPARFSTVTTLFSAHLGDSFTTMSINSSLRPSNATM